MKVQERQDGDVRILKPQGPLITSDARQFGEHLEKVLRDPAAVVLLDLSTVPFVDSAGLEVLADATERLIRSGKALRLAAANDVVAEALVLTELAPLLEVFETVESAMEKLS